MSIFDNADFDSILAGIVYDSRVQSPDDQWDDDDDQPTHQQEVEALEEEDYCGID